MGTQHRTHSYLWHRRSPLVRQYDQLDCGPAALLSVLRYFGGDSNLVCLRTLCRTDIHGTTMLDLINAAHATGLQARGATGEFEELAIEPMPCIAHVILPDGLQHFLVVYRIKGNKLWIGDPGQGKYKLSKDKFLSIWRQKAVILFQPGPKLLREKSVHWITWIWSYMKRQESWLIQILFLGGLFTFMGLITSVFVQTLIDRLIPQKQFDKILILALGLMSILLGRSVIGYLREKFLITANKRTSLQVTADFLEHLYRLPKPFFDVRKTGDITARINDSLKIHQSLLVLFQSAILDTLLIFGSLGLMAFFSWPLAALSFTLLPLYAWVLMTKAWTVKNEQNDVMKSHALLEATYIDSIQGISEIQNHNTGSSFAARNKTIFELFQTRIEKLGLRQAGLAFMTSIVGSVISVAVLCYGGYRVIDGRLLLGKFMAAYSLLAFILPAINSFAIAFIGVQGAQIASQRLLDMLLVPAEPQQGAAESIVLDSVIISSLSFAYPKGTVLLDGLNMSIPKGRITALWGPSGAGKSTLVQLLQKKYTPHSGLILFNGRNIEDFCPGELRSLIGVVPQQIKIFNATLLENILLGRSARSVEEVNSWIKAKRLEVLPGRMPQGLFSKLGEEGVKLSGGEMQLLGLARALYREPPLLVIDEGFSAIDVELEVLLADIISAYAAQHGVLLITHNLDSLQRTDYIYLMQQGQIIQHGAPKDLFVQKGLMQQLCLLKSAIKFGTLEV